MPKQTVLPFSIALVAALAACGGQAVPAEQKQRSAGEASGQLKTILDQMVTEMLRESPEMATSLAVSESLAGGKYAHRLADSSAAGLARRAEQIQGMRARLSTIDRAALGPADATTYDVVATVLDNAIAGQKFDFGNNSIIAATPYVVTQLDGAYTTVPDFLDSQHQVKTIQDAEDYVARVKAFAVVLDQETARIKADAERGIVPPDFVIDGAVKQLKTFAALRPEATVLVQSLARRAAAAKFEPGVQKDLVARVEAAVHDQVLPAYRRQIAQFLAIRARAGHDAGVWRLPDGANYYAVALKAWNTTSLEPDEIHDMGLQLIDQLQAEMDAILDGQGLTSGTVGERVDRLSRDPKQVYPNTEPGRAQLLAALNGQIAALEPLMPRYFDSMVKAKLEIKRVPTYIETGAPGGYYQSPALDGSRAGQYYINLRDTAEWPKFTLPTLTYHEGNPGHHWQSASAQEAKGLHMLRGALVWFSGYGEGWALYAEQLADEMGAYKDDPLGRLGYLQSMTFRAARLVVDTGLHHKRWSREQAIDYMVGVTGDQRSSVTTEVERYSVWPGQATSYMVGRELINRLRDESKAKLGSAFDIRAFHGVVLRNGAMPLSVLETAVRSWTAEQGGAERSAPGGG